MKRRKLLKIIAGIAGCALVIPSGLLVASPGAKEFARRTVLRELNYLHLDPGGLSKFIEDYFQSAPQTFSSVMRWKAYYFLQKNPANSDNLFEIVRTYLLSSDFFVNKTDITKTVHYLGLFNPYKSPVPNPYSYVFKYN